MMLKKSHLIAFGVMVSIATAINSNEGEAANAYVDALLHYLRKAPEKTQVLDPLSLPEIINGKHTLQDITVTGLSNLHRENDVLIMNTGGMMFFIVDIIARNVSISMECNSKMLLFEVQGDTGFVYDDLSLRLILSESQQNLTATLLKVIREGNYYVKYNGYIMIGSLNVDLNNVLQGARGSILGAIENKARGGFDSEIRSLSPYLDERYRSRRDAEGLLLDAE